MSKVSVIVLAIAVLISPLNALAQSGGAAGTGAVGSSGGPERGVSVSSPNTVGTSPATSGVDRQALSKPSTVTEPVDARYKADETRVHCPRNAACETDGSLLNRR